jgi:hypothetical protein
LNETLEGVGLIPEEFDALDRILASKSALGATDDSVETAIEALNRVVESLDDGRRPVWRVDGHLTTVRPSTEPARHVECQVCHLLGITMYDPTIESAYLISHDGRLLLIEGVRYGREHNHYRVKLAGCKAQIPVRETAHVVVSSNHNLSGMTLQEARDERR